MSIRMTPKVFLYKFYHSFPIQLLLLHFRKYQVLLIFWAVLFSTVNGGFARIFGAVSLFLAPEYLGKVNFTSAVLVGLATGIFITSWHITTFILHSKRFKFLATTRQPFFKYYLNNSILPLCFVLFLFYKGWYYQRYNEFNDTLHILWMAIGFICGLLLILFISFFYFFNADRSIFHSLEKRFGTNRNFLKQVWRASQEPDEDSLPVDNYLSSLFKIRRARRVDHYNKHFLDEIFKRHHFAAVITIMAALLLLIILAYLIDYEPFRLPAGASVLIFFAILIAVSGAFYYWLQSWAIPALLLGLVVLNWMLTHNVIDTRNKAYGLNYLNKHERPVYSFAQLNKQFNKELFHRDKDSTLLILNRWKDKCPQPKPKLIVLNFSGGGSRSATWAMNVLQRADSLLHGELMTHTVLMTGASGGMLAAAYYRELYWQKIKGQPIQLFDPAYKDDISKDLLNSVFTAFAVNDLLTPFQYFYVGKNRYGKDRAYAFEKQLNANTHGVFLRKTLADYEQAERLAQIPLLIYSATITADGRRVLMSPQPVSFLCQPQYLYPTRNINDVDAIDFCQFFSKQSPKQLFVTSAMRMSATFPYVLPNVFLPSDPIIDVMDAGLRDNYGQELSLRFLHVFRDWINSHTSGVVFIQIRDTKKNEIYPIKKLKDITDLFTDPLFTLQHHWSAFQDYSQDNQVNYAEHFLKVPFHRIIFQYVPQQEDRVAALNWHLTSREKKDISDALDNPANQSALRYLLKVMK